MQTLPAALAGLGQFRQFVLYKLVASTKKPGKTDKFPLDVRSGSMASSTDPTTWVSFDEAAAALASGRGDGIGFVFSDADPFFFLDIDHALQADGTWSPLAQQLCAAFPGAAVEVSQSGTGLHIIGRAQVPPNHRCRNQQLGLEFYSRERFVALTGAHATGSVDSDFTNVVPWLLEHFITPGAEEVADYGVDDWTEAPREDWAGPVDDEELLRRAMRSASVKSMFGGKATFADLWLRDVDKLAGTYPSTNDAPFGESEADAALASMLAFWTGCNMERMRVLMQRSALARDKWGEPRPGGTWLDMTIRNACRVQRDVCRDRNAAQAPAPHPAGPAADALAGAASAPPRPAQGPTPYDGPVEPPARPDSAFVRPAQARELFAGCVYVLDQHKTLIPGGMLLKPDQFKTLFAGRVFVMDEANERICRNAWEAFTESTINSFAIADSAWFRPALDPGVVTVHEGRRYVNTYSPADVRRVPGDVTPFLAHLARVLPNERDREILLAYMAACVQHVGVKFQWAPLLQGAEGNGKSLFSRCVAYAVGERYTHWPRADQITAKFNSWLLGRLFIGVEDMYLPEDRGEVFEILKPMITSDRQPVEPKGVDQQSLWVCCNFILNSNHKDALRKTRGDRRIAPLYCAQQSDNPDDVSWITAHGMGGDYFPNLYNWLKADGYAHVAHYLTTYAIPDDLNPATHCTRAPITSSTEEAIRMSLGTVEQEINEAIASDTPGFCGGWISSFALGKLLERIGKSRAVPLRKRDETLAQLGYIRHPALAGGRVDNIVLPDSGKPVLFVKRDSPGALIAKPADAARAYTVAQGVKFG